MSLLILSEGFFDEVFSRSWDVSTYFVMGAVGTLLFSIKMFLLLVFGIDDGAGDFDLDGDADVGDAGDAGFSLFSLLSILSFLMGAGWMGFACRWDWGLEAVPAALAASGFGFSLMLLSSFGMYQMRKMNVVGRYDVNHCVGNIGRVYMSIPAKGQGRGEVQISVDGRQKTLSAISNGEAIESFKAVRVVGVQEGETIIVEPAD